MLTIILRRLSNQVDDFLPRWTKNMEKAGYLTSTTAKREDCILSFRWFLEPAKVKKLEILTGFPETSAVFRAPGTQ